MVDDDYDGSNFVVKQVFFCGGDKRNSRSGRKASATGPGNPPNVMPRKP
jgi:adenine-specific DNA-methyltransferase